MDVGSRVRRSLTLIPGALLLALTAFFFSASVASAAHSEAVYTETNQLKNQMVVLSRLDDGSLRVVQRIDTGGKGALNNPPFPQDHLDAVNEVEMTANGKLLFAVNAGSDTISSFRIGPNGRLTLADQKSSGGHHPVSVDTHNGLLYVLNELDQTGKDISGMRYSATGKLTPIPGSTKALATPFAADNGFGFPSPLADQVLFSPDGKELTVPERTSNGFQGQIDTFAISSKGIPGPARVNTSNAFIPFGMAWDGNGHLIVANGGSPLVMPMFQGSGSSYSLNGTKLTAIDMQPTNALGTCWVTISKDGKYAFMSDQNTAQVSRFAIGSNGKLTLLGNVSTSGPGSDTALSDNGRFLYVLNVLNANGSHGATIDRFFVQRDGTLTLLGTTDPKIPDSASGLAAR